ncbi:MAG: ABC transporter permease [Deltaproteobacteria bacterium]|nr:MAG: ABC transporter permease [Deltaproteobacteria bacterium]
MSYEVFIGLRHLKGRNRSQVVSLLTLISILGVVVGVWALTVVLSVLTGFGNDLKKKIINSTPHMVIDRHTGEVVHPERICKKVQKVRDVTDCSPFITNEIMLSSKTNNAGVLLRGITAGSTRVKNLVKQMDKGNFKHLFKPKLIPASPEWETISPGSLPPNTRMLRDLVLPKKSDKSSPSNDAATGPTPGRDSSSQGTQPTSSPSKKGKPKARNDKTPPPPPVFRAPPELREFQSLRRKKPRRNYPGILLGKELSQMLGVMVGDVVRGVSPLGGSLTPMGPAPRVRKYRVAGIFFTGMYEYDTKFAFVTLRSAQKLFKMYDVSTGIELGVKDLYQTPTIKKKIKRVLGGGAYRVKDWVEMNSQLFGALKMEKIAMFIILTLIIFVASFNIVSTLTMVVLEKTEEIAILKSMGATRSSIMRVFMIQGIAVGVIGTAIGLFLGWRTCVFLMNHPIPMNTDVYYIASLPVQMYLTDFVAVAIASVFISFLATLYPALQASRLRPVEGLQHE